MVGVLLNKEQLSVLSLLDKCENIFITGAAGTGKSFVLEQVVRRCNEIGENVYVTASTGVAALNIDFENTNSMTFHGWASIGLGVEPLKILVRNIIKNKTARERIRKTEVLIIDEISMIQSDFFEVVNEVVQKVRNCDKPFGGIQLVLSGDFAQLPPIKQGYLFESKVWKDLDLQHVELHQVYRQQDKEFVDLLSRLRTNTLTNEDILKIQATEHNEFYGPIKPTKLLCLNKDVDGLNNIELDKLRGDATVFDAIDTGKYSKVNFKFAKKLRLKKDAQVMLLINQNLQKGLINGARGVVLKCSLDCGVTVLFSNGEIVNFTPVKQDVINEDGKIIASRMQIPLKLAFCLTIHKSQGMTIDMLDIDLKDCFENAQAYVALSRAKSLKYIKVRNFTKHCVNIRKAVEEFHNQTKRQKLE